MKHLIIALLVLTLWIGFIRAQSFTFFDPEPGRQLVEDVIQDKDGTYLCIGTTETGSLNTMKPYAFTLSPEGQKISATYFEEEIGNAEGFLGKILPTSEGTYIITGALRPEKRTDWQLWVFHMDSNFNVFWSKTYGRPEWDEMPAIGVINQKGEIIIADDSDSDPDQWRDERDIFFYRLSPDGDSLFANYHRNPSWQLLSDIIPNEDNNGYYVFTQGVPDGEPFIRNHIAETDTLFQFTNMTPLPYNMYSNISAKWGLDFLILYAGRRHNFRYIGQEHPGQIDIGLVMYDVTGIGAANLVGNIGHEDTGEVEALFKGLDFLSLESIYLGGTSQLDYERMDPLYSEKESYFVLGNFSYIEKKWEKYYGGDAYYILQKVLATRDGGALLAGTRYHHLSSTDRDIYILKVDAEGNI